MNARRLSAAAVVAAFFLAPACLAGTVVNGMEPVGIQTETDPVFNTWVSTSGCGVATDTTGITNRLVTLEGKTNDWNSSTSRLDLIEAHTSAWNSVTNPVDTTGLTNRVVVLEGRTNDWNGIGTDGTTYVNTVTANIGSSSTNYVDAQVGSISGSATNYTDARTAITGSAATNYTDARTAATGSAATNYVDARTAVTGSAATNYVDARTAATGSAATNYIDARTAAVGSAATNYADSVAGSNWWTWAPHTEITAVTNSHPGYGTMAYVGSSDGTNLAFVSTAETVDRVLHWEDIDGNGDENGPTISGIKFQDGQSNRVSILCARPSDMDTNETVNVSWAAWPNEASFGAGNTGVVWELTWRFFNSGENAEGSIDYSTSQTNGFESPTQYYVTKFSATLPADGWEKECAVIELICLGNDAASTFDRRAAMNKCMQLVYTSK